MYDTLVSASEGLGPDDDLDDLAEESEASEPELPSGWPDVELDQQGCPRERSRGGRPSLYTLPRVLTILGELFDGASRADAAKRAGVGVSTLYVWLDLGRRGHPTFA